jgi:formate-dependent nitrite reductase membrane component NrfD
LDKKRLIRKALSLKKSYLDGDGWLLPALLLVSYSTGSSRVGTLLNLTTRCKRATEKQSKTLMQLKIIIRKKKHAFLIKICFIFYLGQLEF